MTGRRREGREPAQRRNQRSPDRGDQPGRAIAPKAPPLPLAGMSRRGPDARLQHRHPPFAADGSSTAASRPPAERDRRLTGEEEGGTSAALPDQSCHSHAGRSARACGRVGGSRDVIAAGPRGGVRSAACSRAGSAAPAAARGTPGRGSVAILGPCPCSRNIPFQKKNGV